MYCQLFTSAQFVSVMSSCLTELCLLFAQQIKTDDVKKRIMVVGYSFDGYESYAATGICLVQ